MPKDFALQPRHWQNLTKGRQLSKDSLLYTDPIVLKDAVYKKSLTTLFFSVVMLILLYSNDERRRHYLDYAKQLLMHFVEMSESIYGDTFTVSLGRLLNFTIAHSITFL